MIDATYVDGITGQPLLDALPKQMTIEELQKKLTVVPELPDSYKEASVQERLELTERIGDVYIPLDFSAAIYNLLYSGLRSAYRGKTRVSITRNLSAIGRGIQRHDSSVLEAISMQAESFSVLGEPGMGKTETVTRILKTIPQVIRHSEYEGRRFEEYQTTYLKIECPANNSPRGACFQILGAVDGLMGTTLVENAESRHANVDTLIMCIAQVCTRFHVGCIVIDEIQNVLPSNSVMPSPNNILVKFLVELANKTGVCLLFIGTPVIAPYFDAEAHLARRTRGPRIPPLQQNEAFVTILRAMWEQVPVLYPRPIDSGLIELIYRITGGVLAKMQKLVKLSAQHAIMFGEEVISGVTLKKVAKQYGIAPGNTRLTVDPPNILQLPIEAATKVPNKTPIMTDAQMTVEESAAMSRSKKRGRPKAQRNREDIIELFKDCREHGWLVKQSLRSIGLLWIPKPKGGEENGFTL